MGLCVGSESEGWTDRGDVTDRKQDDEGGGGWGW